MFWASKTNKLFVWTVFAAVSWSAGETNLPPSTRYAVESGTAAFVANTNVSAISVKGKSTALSASLRFRRSPHGLEIDEIEASVPVKSIFTGMSLRDEHMRKYIFTTNGGETPDLRFEARGVTCSAGSCQVAGNLTIRGLARPFTVPLKIRDDGSSVKASGEALVKLSDYGIERPSQFGVKTADEVALHFDFTARESRDVVASAGGGR